MRISATDAEKETKVQLIQEKSQINAQKNSIPSSDFGSGAFRARREIRHQIRRSSQSLALAGLAGDPARAPAGRTSVGLEVVGRPGESAVPKAERIGNLRQNAFDRAVGAAGDRGVGRSPAARALGAAAVSRTLADQAGGHAAVEARGGLRRSGERKTAGWRTGKKFECEKHLQPRRRISVV